MTTYPQYDSTFFSRRTTALVLIIGLHAAVIYAFATGLTHRIVDVIPASMQTTFLQDPQPRDDPPPPPPRVKLTPQRIDIITTTPKIVIDEPPEIRAIREVVAPSPDPGPPEVEVAVSRVLGGPGKGFPNSDDYYPPAARRLDEQGSATVQVCVDKEGRLTANPTVTQSSGSARLDAGALKLAKAASGHYRPTTENGLAVSSCYGYRIKFDLRD